MPGVITQIRSSYSIVRMDLAWSKIEKEKGVYNFTEYDVLLNALLNTSHTYRSVLPYMIFDYGNPLYQNGEAPSTTETIKAFINYVIASIKRYQNNGIIWELWNEPNAEYSWKPYPNSTAYAVLASSVGYSVKKEFPNEILIGPATAEIDLTFIENVFKYNNSEILKYFDAISVHPYRIGGPETVIERYIQLKNLIIEYQNLSNVNNKDIPIISGEWGWSTCYNSNNKPDACIGGAPTGIVSYLDQAKYLVRQWVINDAMKIPISIFYDYKNDGNNEHQGEDNFGTVQYKYQNESVPYLPKLSYLAAKTYQGVVNDMWRYELIGRLTNITCNDCVSDDVYVVEYVTEGEAAGTMFITWYTKSDIDSGINATLSINNGQKYDRTQTPICNDMFGTSMENCVTFIDETTFILQNVTDCPMYFVMWFV